MVDMASRNVPLCRNKSVSKCPSISHTPSLAGSATLCQKSGATLFHNRCRCRSVTTSLSRIAPTPLSRHQSVCPYRGAMLCLGGIASQSLYRDQGLSPLMSLGRYVSPTVELVDMVVEMLVDMVVEMLEDMLIIGRMMLVRM